MAIREAADKASSAQAHADTAPYLDKINALREAIAARVVGQTAMIRRLLIGLFTQGHILLEGVPGLAKTLTVNTLARALDLSFQRIQFTPDLLPADLIGTLIYNPQKTTFEVKKGPIFAHIVLADEVNRAPAKVQSALLEVMQEKQVTLGDKTYALDEPFLVLATQNPIEQEGTYPLPEAQVDRFMMRVFVDYPSREEEREIMRRFADLSPKPPIQPILSKKDLHNIKGAINSVAVAEPIARYIIDLSTATRHPEEVGLESMAHYVRFGASPRASIFLNLAAKAEAFLQGRHYVLPEDVKTIAADVLNHRILLNYEAEADDITPRNFIDAVLDKVAIQR